MPSAQLPRSSKSWQRLKTRKITNRRTGETMRNTDGNIFEPSKSYYIWKATKNNAFAAYSSTH